MDELFLTICRVLETNRDLLARGSTTPVARVLTAKIRQASTPDSEASPATAPTNPPSPPVETSSGPAADLTARLIELRVALVATHSAAIQLLRQTSPQYADVLARLTTDQRQEGLSQSQSQPPEKQSTGG